LAQGPPDLSLGQKAHGLCLSASVEDAGPPSLARRRGDCGQYADLFIAMCRSAGVPARFVGGFAIDDSKTGRAPVVGSHAGRSSLPGDGSWVPVDPTGDEEGYFGRCKVNTHITASVGRNIPLPNVPALGPLPIQ